MKLYRISDNRIDADDQKLSELMADGILNAVEVDRDGAEIEVNILFEMNTLTEVAFTEKNVVDTVLYAALGIKEDT